MKLKEIRTKKNLSQYRLAKLSGVSQGLLSAYESGKKKPGYDNIVKLAKGLEVSVGDLLDEAKRRNRKIG